MAKDTKKTDDKTDDKNRTTSGSLIDVIRRICFRFDMATFNDLAPDGKFCCLLMASKHFVDLSSGQVIPLDNNERLRRTEAGVAVVYAPVVAAPVVAESSK